MLVEKFEENPQEATRSCFVASDVKPFHTQEEPILACEQGLIVDGKSKVVLHSLTHFS